MTTRHKRYSVTLPVDLETMIEKEAAFQSRSVSNQIAWILDQWFGEKKKELDYFRPIQSGANAGHPPQVFETPRPVSEQASKLRDALGRERS